MKKFFLFAIMASLVIFSACDKDDDDSSEELTGAIEIEFDNVFVDAGVQKQLSLVNKGATQYNYTNAMGQDFNVVLLRYFITNIVLEGPDGLRYEDVVESSATESKGYYIVDESDFNSQVITLSDVPAGEYNRITFTVGVDSTGVIEGAAGGALDPTTNNMYWNWNAGYVAVKFEGHSAVSVGSANGEIIKPDVDKGIVYHVGGWRDDPNRAAFVYNNKRLSYAFDTNAKVSDTDLPTVHMTFDVNAMLGSDAKNMIDFTGNNDVHRPIDGQPVAENLENAFSFDHVHQ